MNNLEIGVSPLELDSSQTLRRVPPRPLQQRPSTYDEEFDYLNIFYDCFVSSNGEEVICIGPPLNSIEHSIVPIISKAFGQRFFSRVRVRHFDRHSQLWFCPRTRSAEFESGLFRQEAVEIQPNHCAQFRGKRVLMTISKNNELVWIRDWVRFYARHHGCNAVLIYDNGSTHYDLEMIRREISSIQGIDITCVVHWPYKWGPRWGTNPLRYWKGPNGIQHEFWDSDFMQYATFEHARYRFLDCAAAVINADIDELVLTDNQESIFDLAQRSQTGFLNYGGIWVENACDTASSFIKTYKDYFYNTVPPRPASAKWTVVPERCPRGSLWCVHWVLGMKADELSEQASYRHFMGININSNFKRRRQFDEWPGLAHQPDKELISWMRALETSNDPNRRGLSVPVE